MKNEQNQALTALMRSLKRALKQQHGIDVPHAALRASYLAAQGENPHAFASKQEAVSPADAHLRKLVEEAPNYFHPGYDFEGNKLRWLQRAGLTNTDAAFNPPTPGENIGTDVVRTFYLAEDSMGCNVMLALGAENTGVLPDSFSFRTYSATLVSLYAEVPRVSEYGLPDYLEHTSDFFCRFGLMLGRDASSSFVDTRDDSGDTCKVQVSLSAAEWRRVVACVLGSDFAFVGQVAEWVGLHYSRNFPAMPAAEKVGWVERYLEAHAEGLSFLSEADDSSKV